MKENPTVTPDILRNTNILPYTQQEHKNVYIIGSQYRDEANWGYSLFDDIVGSGNGKYGTRDFFFSRGENGPLCALNSATTPEVVFYRRQFFDELIENRQFSKAFETITRAIPHLVPQQPDGVFVSYETTIRRVKKLACYPEALRQVEKMIFAPEVWNQLQIYAHAFLEEHRSFITIADTIRERGITYDNVDEAFEMLDPYSREIISSVSTLRHQMLTYRAFEGIFYTSMHPGVWEKARTVCKPNLTYSADACMEMKDMYHPLLTYQTPDGKRLGSVPNNLSIDPDNSMMILTGPNTGGKSGFRMAAQLNTLLVSSGFWAFAETVRGSPFRRQWSLGELSDTVGHEGTFGSLLDYGIEVRDNVTRQDIVFFDELDRGTMPADQQWFARGVLHAFAHHHIPTVAITHDLDLVSSLETNPSIAIYRVADYEAGEKRFKIFPGIANAGYGRQKAREKNMDPESVEKTLASRLGN